MLRDRKSFNLIFIDQQSYNNLSKYDLNIMSRLFYKNITYLCSDKLDQPVSGHIKVRKLFSYNFKKNAISKAISYSLSLIRTFCICFQETKSIIHMQWSKLPFIDFLFIVLIKVLTQNKVVLTAHNVVPHDSEQKQHKWIGRIYRKVDAIIVHVQASKKELKKVFAISEKKIHVIPHGLINLQKGISIHANEINRFCRQKGITFCFFGHGNRYKGLDLLLQAWQTAISSQELPARLLVIGKIETKLRYLLKAITPEHQNSILVIDEFVPEGDLYNAVINADVIVFPYHEISQSGALLSTLGLRKAIIVSNLPGLIEPIKIADIGWIFKCKNQLISIIERLAYQPDLVNKITGNSSAWSAINDYYSWEKISKKHHELYSALARQIKNI